jgi:hypothetical protein
MIHLVLKHDMRESLEVQFWVDADRLDLLCSCSLEYFTDVIKYQNIE